MQPTWGLAGRIGRATSLGKMTMGFILTVFVAMAVATMAITRIVRARRRAAIARLVRADLDAETDRLLMTPGEPLFCAMCQAGFRGPMGVEGCPHCECAAFVVPEKLRKRRGPPRRPRDRK